MAETHWNHRRQSFEVHVFGPIGQGAYWAVPNGAKSHTEKFGPFTPDELDLVKNQKSNITADLKQHQRELAKKQEDIGYYGLQIIYALTEQERSNWRDRCNEAEAEFTEQLEKYGKIVEGFGIISSVLDWELRRVTAPDPHKAWS